MRASPLITVLCLTWFGCRNAPTAPAPDRPAPPDTRGDDMDGDGYTTADGDCDDSAATVHPGGDEGTTPDGRDNDCDGIPDGIASCPGEDAHPTMQAAIDATADGWTLMVCAGTWTEDLDLSGRAITLYAAEGPGRTDLIGTGGGPVLTFDDATGGVIGFTITGGLSADHGGGVRGTDCTLHIEGNRIHGNSAADIGGGVGLIDCDATIYDNEIFENSGRVGGGIGADDGSVDISNNEITVNAALPAETDVLSTAGSGGGGVFIRGDGAVTGNTIAGNTSTLNGGGLYAYKTTGEISGNLLQRNQAAGDGGGVFTNFAAGRFGDNEVRDNTAGDDAGGMRVFVGEMAIEDSLFVGNSAADDGGGLKLSHAANTVRRCTFSDNSAGDSGGGLELDNDHSTVDDCTFTGNTATTGAGLHSWDNEAEVWIHDSRFEDNIATGCGGAIGLDQDAHAVHLLRVIAIGNSAAWGGGVCAQQYTPLDVRNTVIAGNTATASGGGISASTGSLTLDHTVVANNNAPYAGALEISYSTATLRNSIISDNAGAPALYFSGSTLSAEYNALFENEGGISGVDEPLADAGNITDDPTFSAPSAGDYSLQMGSPCVDAADPDTTDPDGTRADMGAHGGAEADALP